MNVKVDKYIVIQEKDGPLKALRHGEKWRDCTGDNLIYTLASEVEHLREVIAKADAAITEVATKMTMETAFEMCTKIRPILR